jgi:AcrR family transcriptional regulator
VANPARTSPRARNPRGQGERLREALIEAATELLAELEDAEALSVRAVTARVGVTPTALYLHFADKDELLETVKDRCFGELRSHVRAAEDQAGPDPRAQLEQMCEAYVRFAAEHPGHYRVLFYTRRRRQLEWSDAGREAFGDLVRAVERCLLAGRDPSPVALMVWAGLHGYVGLRAISGHFLLPDPATNIEQLLDAHLAE